MDEKKQRIMNINSELPPEILSIMFHKLSFPYLPICRLVCRAWNSLISSSKFHCNLFITWNPPNHLHCVDLDSKHLKGMIIAASFKLHTIWSDIKIANSCNGLLCISTRNMRTRTDSVAILNPSTNEYIKLPREIRDREYYYALGFSPKTKQYKVVRHQWKKRQNKTLVEIFAFGTSHALWAPVTFDTIHMEKKGVYLDGAIYWIGVYERGSIRRYGLWRLEVEDEKFDEICCPPLGRNNPIYCGVFNDTLYVTLINEDSMFRVWTMDKKGLWIRAFVVAPYRLPNACYRFEPIDFHFHIIKLYKDGKMLCLFRAIHLGLYDPKTKKLERLYHQKGLVKFLWFHQINSFDFHSLRNILAGDAA